MSSKHKNLRVNQAELQEHLLGPWAEDRRQLRKIMEEPIFHYQFNLTKEDQRELAMQQIQELADRKLIGKAYPKAFGGKEDPGGNVAGFSEMFHANPSMQIKGGVQWGLFGSAILTLGNEEQHQRWLPGVLSLELPGVYAMTEIGHGSDVGNVDTTATFIPEDDEFEIHTPFRAAWKEFLGNAAKDGKAAVVFAQLITKNVNYGVHAFFVPLRDDDGNFLPGVGGEDDGFKGGLNGIDNGRLHFTHVRIPRTNLLNKLGDVDENGDYTTSIPSSGRRFFTMLGALVQGRVSLATTAANASALALTGAITYGNQRRQFNAASDIEEQVLLDYGLHQRRLIDRLARTYADIFTTNDLLSKFHEVFSGEDDTDDNRQELETLAAGIKAVTTWNAMDTFQESREATGGAGYIASKNRFSALRDDLDIYTTFEGDNNVLLQLVGRRLLGDYSKELANPSFKVLSRYVAERAEQTLYERSGLRRVVQQVSDIGSDRRSAAWLKDPEVQRNLFTDRVRTQIAEVAEALRPVAKKSQEEQARVFNENQYELIKASKSHAQLLQWESFTDALDEVKDPETQKIMTWMRDLFALSTIEQDLGWFIEYGRISQQRARTLREYTNRLAARLRPHAQELVDAFGYNQNHLRMDITSGIERERQDEAMEYYRHLRASGDAPIPEKVYRARQK
ncbi:MAG: acyl-CoA dehydrogenase family protein [Yaniella sp.]|uniref:acyl-CoA dehydrogenase family protein n=2 Tax=Yaniella sp. TaxID=2773929 RepID=UPI002647DA1D|nr:acyl-CoA dehydrogenase [Yaniella sp.]MDN5730601.1 acyl-CoA dehydrogenase family protein [Yaniella sp.]MDN5814934.1 acyl-CoA dehydrogenase family protein [Yaniella sp.]MDN5817313.1 acyl-CoA dehydrogenase family protein [Yaniella sp.]MDN5837513.1 acyl-CoA dehydrogenase family protein [Yaniella sp.]MDN5889887.1 acyl-CoA dehydrogenase family protein [Yaniella sp.]